VSLPPDTLLDLLGGPPERAIDPPPHQPSAAVLACSDARIAPARLLDAPEGSLFVVRHAGNTATPQALASLDYAVEHLGVDTVVVMGHTDCGAVPAALSRSVEPALEPIVAPVRPSIIGLGIDDAVEASRRNVATTVAALRDHDGPTGRAIRAGSATVAGALHHVGSSHLESVPATPADLAA
jgi:carbonic anhydrase